MTRNRLFDTIFITIVFVNLLGVFNGIFTADSALYAAISKTLVTSGNWLDLFVNGKDWLDKPHFPFWTSAISMKLFGINAFAYKLPSFLFYVLSLFYTYKFSSKLYSKEVGFISVLILSSALHIIVSNNDVRAEATMLGLLMGSTYHYYQLSLKFRLRDLLLGSLLSAAAIMTKGIFILIPLASAVFFDIVFKRRWQDLFKWRWIWCIFLMLVFIMPELWAVYSQFDLHPEKVVFGKTNVSGIKFFFWDSQFGRFFNIGPIQGKGDITFFFHTLIWAFAPWAIIAYASIFKSLKNVFQGKRLKEYATLFGFLIMLVIFSLSKFQLPHYVNIIFPYLSIILANYLVGIKGRAVTYFKIAQLINFALLLPLLPIIIYYFRPGNTIILVLILLFTIGIAIYIFITESSVISRYIYSSVLVSVLVGLFLNLIFYPKLLSYQSGTNAAKYVNKNFPECKVASTVFSPLHEFYLNKELIRLNNLEQLQVMDENTVVFIFEDDLERLDKLGIKYEVVQSLHHFHTTRLNTGFFNIKTRADNLEKRYLIKL